ncbi:F-box protein SKIP23-like [Solanum lycopersicum]|uniref:F-box protein SKIP23-like n=1 Tax=Solanum lycopersicum TaxID=4081 RepID=UPI000532C6F3|nr:F-box protein SKIP23-like [Solanum lycopersicum]
MASGWSELPKDLLWSIATCLVTYTDQVRFTCVCTSWRSVLPTIEVRSHAWLLLPRNNDTNKEHEKFYSLHEKKDSPRISLFNPFTRVQIALPPRYKFPDVRKYCAKKLDTEYALEPYDGQKNTYLEAASHVHNSFLDKLVLSSSPTSSKAPNCMVAAIYGSHCNLAYCKVGDKRWTCIAKGRMGYDDAIFHDQKLYAVTFTSYVEVQRHTKSTGDSKTYLYRTTFFNLYMYEPSRRSWCKVENIGENVLFLGLNTSISIASSDLHGYKGNHIYFTDNFLDFHEFGVKGGYDIGVYDLDSRRVQSLPCHDIEKRWLWPTPIWYIHNPEDFIEQDKDATTKLN